MEVAFRLNGKAIGVDPTPQAGQAGDAAFPVYADRDAVGGWEHAEITPHDKGQFAVRFVVANRQLSLGPNGLESRAAGAVGPWELFYLTDQPDGSSLAYRFNDDGTLAGAIVLTVEAVS